MNTVEQNTKERKRAEHMYATERCKGRQIVCCKCHTIFKARNKEMAEMVRVQRIPIECVKCLVPKFEKLFNNGVLTK